jgi:hypothetical protein
MVPDLQKDGPGGSKNYITLVEGKTIFLFWMKKFMVVIVAILYMGLSTGVTFHMHYCMEKLVGIGLWHGKAKKCSNCGMEKATACKKSCCKDEHKIVKLGKDHKNVETAISLMQLVSTATLTSYIELPQVYALFLAEEYPITHSPPRSGQVKIHILNCTYLI